MTDRMMLLVFWKNKYDIMNLKWMCECETLNFNEAVYEKTTLYYSNI